MEKFQTPYEDNTFKPWGLSASSISLKKFQTPYGDNTFKHEKELL